MSEIKKGDTVRLKSGSPTMTVEDISNYSNHGMEQGARCVWFEGSTCKKEVFDVAVLAHHDTNSSASVVRVNKSSRGRY